MGEVHIAITEKTLPTGETPNSTPRHICLICYSHIGNQENCVPGMPRLEGREHDICYDCFREHLISKINGAKVDKIYCPHCMANVDEATIQSIVCPDLYVKYKRYKLNLDVTLNPLARWCPLDGCGNVIMLSATTDKSGTCSRCMTEICASCSRKIHQGKTCDEMIGADLKSWAKNVSLAKCPKCRMMVEKIDGCNHMTCR
eukprot:TRINITY_DN12084_c0_g1_i1.p1 TRINITY_DN12084_c0_g1~~TRINITY_DN12084_c0_g1_i1.p1  ORF type:complete len:234 (-),score=23.10 TRINITY_DN12084_c0_g1_i1:459-1061(-)